jgi:hypothetical protein
MLLCMTFHTNNPVSNTQELHCLTSKEYIYNMYIHELDISSLFLFYQIFYRSYLAFPLHLEEFIDINSGANHLTYSPKCVSQILIALDFVL